MAKIYTLEDYGELAYEFAIRNPRVIELISSPLADDVVKELKDTFGIDVQYDEWRGDEYDTIPSLKALYLEYEHLGLIDYHPLDNQYKNTNLDTCKKRRKIIQPKFWAYTSEPIEKAITRIHKKIESRGKKLERLMNGKAFKNYDDYTFNGMSIYAIDPSTKTKKTIKTDIKNIAHFIEPSEYLQLLPLFIDPVAERIKDINADLKSYGVSIGGK